MTHTTVPRREARLAAVALAALAAGLLVYWGQRDVSHSTLIPAFPVIAGSIGFGTLGQWLPSFLHTLAFGLLTAVVLPPRFALRAAACCAWAVVNIAFEAGQHPRLAAAWGETFGPGPITSYFERGTFDAGDIVAALLGALVAIGVFAATRSTSRNCDEDA